MISHKHKFILITPPKTGSTSLLKSLMKYCDIERINTQGGDVFDIIDEFKDISPWLKKWGSKHITIREVQTGLNRVNKNINDYIKIGVVRNPFDRVPAFWLRRKHLGMSLSQFTQTVKPCLHYLTAPNIREMAMDHIIRFENLQLDFNTICDIIGLPHEKLAHINKLPHKHYSEYYDDEARELVAQQHAKDIEYFGYEYGK